MLPSKLKDSIKNGKTSLGDHPAFPPEDEEKFIVRLVEREYDKVNGSCGYDNVHDAKIALSRLVTEAMKREESVKEALEGICMKVVCGIFEIPEDAVNLKMEIVKSVDISDIRKLPEPTEDFSFEDTEEMDKVTGMIYHRRFMNAIVCGASYVYSSVVQKYLSDIFELDPELPAIYKKITDINTWLLYAGTGIPDTDKNGGRVDVYPGTGSTKAVVNAKGVIFPMLLSESIKGILELAVSKGLPENVEIREYIVKKSDFSMAELWDLRLGIPLWERIEHIMRDSGCEMRDIGLNFIMMELACMDTEEFNKFMGNVLAGTNKGKKDIRELADGIVIRKEKDDFDDFMKYKNDHYALRDDTFKPGEILAELSI